MTQNSFYKIVFENIQNLLNTIYLGAAGNIVARHSGVFSKILNHNFQYIFGFALILVAAVLLMWNGYHFLNETLMHFDYASIKQISKKTITIRWFLVGLSATVIYSLLALVFTKAILILLIPKELLS